MFGDFPIRGLLIVAAIGVLGTLGFSAISNGLADGQPAAPLARASSPPSPRSTATATATPAPPLKTAAPSATLRPTDPPALQPGEWFWVTDISGTGDAVQSQNIAVSVTSARFGQLTAYTLSDATCVATGRYPSGAPIAANGLGQATADSSGVVRWTFFGSPAERGRASYQFTCSKGSNLRTLQVLFDIP
ncbi:MAG TPA: hypothetical protein VIA63_04805 [Candidatus Limnocylindria bacterium]